MEIFLFILGFGVFAFFILFVLIVASKALAEKRRLLADRADQLGSQTHGLASQMSAVDEKTAGRVRDAIQAVQEKIVKAQQVSERGRDRDFARAHSILDQAQAKIDNANAGIERAQNRMQESEQRRQERAAQREQQRAEAAAQRQAEREARKAAGVRSGSFGSSGRMVTTRSTDWNTVPTRERGVCFFCSRPSHLAELFPVTVPLNGRPTRVLACHEDYLAIQGGQEPPIRAFYVEHHYVPWFVYSDYDPYTDYYVRGYDSTPYMDRWTPDHFDYDQPYWNVDSDGLTGNDTPGYTFTPDQENYQDFYTEQAAGAASGGDPYAPEANFSSPDLFAPADNFAGNTDTGLDTTGSSGFEPLLPGPEIGDFATGASDFETDFSPDDGANVESDFDPDQS